MSVLDRFRAAHGQVDRSLSFAEWTLYADQAAKFAGNSYPLGVNTTYGKADQERIGDGFGAYAAGLMASPPAFGAQLVRSLVLSQAGFRFRRYDSTLPASERFFTTEALAKLQRPWPKGTTGELISKMEWHAGIGGNAFVYDAPNRLYVLRPDWVTLIHGSDNDPDMPQWQLDSELLGYLYHPGGRHSGAQPWMIPTERMAHWSPLPDPLSPERGMAWMTPIIREIDADVAATAHKVKYFENGATPNLVVTGIPAKTPEEFDKWVDAIDQGHTGVKNAYKTLYFTSGVDATVVGSNMKDIDYKALQGVSETRISVASRVPAPVLGISEGLAGSSLNAGNYGQSRRNLSDIWMYPTLISLVQCLAQIVDEPPDAQLWHDTSDMPFLREDAKDAADIESVKATTIRTLVDGGFTPESAVDAVMAGDMSLLVHAGRLSVQLQSIDGSDEESDAIKARAAVEAVQKVYLGVVNGVLSAEEARDLINKAGGDLSGPPPTVSPPPTGVQT